MFEEMKGKVAVVTGATSGIGRASALVLAKQGIKVALAGRNEKAGKALENEIVANGGKALFIRTDVSNDQSVRDLLSQTTNAFGPIDYALNNAGIEGKLAPLEDLEESDFDKVIATNLKGVWLCLKHQLRALSSHGGSIVNISTNIAQSGMATVGAYIASKAGVEGLTRVAAVENGKKGIRVNAVNPGAVDTPMIHRVHPTDEGIQAVNDFNPMGRMAQPDEIGRTVLWLLSPLASHVNGSVIYVDGGSSLV